MLGKKKKPDEIENLVEKIHQLQEEMDGMGFGTEERESAQKELKILYDSYNEAVKAKTSLADRAWEIGGKLIVPFGFAISTIFINTHLLKMDQKIQASEGITTKKAEGLIQKPKPKFF